MRPILAAIIAAILTAVMSHFIEGLFNEIIVALGIGLLSGVSIMFALRPREGQNIGKAPHDEN